MKVDKVFIKVGKTFGVILVSEIAWMIKEENSTGAEYRYTIFFKGGGYQMSDPTVGLDKVYEDWEDLAKLNERL